MSRQSREQRLVRPWILSLAAAATVTFSGCGTDSMTDTAPTGTTRGTLLQDPPLRIASVNATSFAAQLGATPSGAQLLEVAGTPVCGVDFYYIQYNTVGGAGEATTASGALMVPTGSATQCSGGRPIVLYAHGTNTNKALNLAAITDPSNTEGALIAAMFAAQGYIVVAPNYAGYDSSTLPYHPYLNADQQSKDMIDALTAARTALPNTLSSATKDGGKLFITGYSQGGHVAMATHRAMQAAGMAVTASAPMSGPYALEAFGDAVFYGQVNIGSTIFTPFLVTSYQQAYGNIYTDLTDVYEANYASNLANLLPSDTPIDTLFSNGTLPESALFNSTPPATGNAMLDAALAVPTNNPVFAAGFGTSNLVTNDFRLAYVLDAVANPDGAVPVPTAGVPQAANPQNPMRIAFKTNDLRNWTPQSPVLMCGGDADPTVFFSVNTQVMQQYWAALPAGLVTVVDINAAPTSAADPFAAAKVGYQTTIAQIAAVQGDAAAEQAIHATEAPFCTAVARGFFGQF